MMNRRSVACLVIVLSGVIGAAPLGHTAASHPVAEKVKGQCGVDRWAVKTGIDQDASLVNLTPQPATIADLQAKRRPSHIPAKLRVVPVETTVWAIQASLVRYQLEADSDYHLILQDEQGHHMIAELPSPKCVSAASRFGDAIAAVRHAFDATYRASKRMRKTSTPVWITGVGFFDTEHGQSGEASNGIELHPVLSLSFQAPTPTPTPSPIPTSTPIPTPSPTYTSVPTDTPTATPTDTPTATPTATPGPYGKSGAQMTPTAVVSYVQPTNTPYVYPTQAPVSYPTPVPPCVQKEPDYNDNDDRGLPPGPNDKDGCPYRLEMRIGGQVVDYCPDGDLGERVQAYHLRDLAICREMMRPPAPWQELVP